MSRRKLCHSFYVGSLPCLQDMELSYVPQVLAVSSHTMSVVLVDIEICRGNCGKDR